MDKTDHTILSLIQHDTNLSVAEIADRVSLSQAPCWRRIKRLEQEGFIRTRVAMLDRKQLGLNLVVYAEIKLTGNGRLSVQEFESMILAMPEVTECHAMLGRIDYLLRIVTKDVESYDWLLRNQLAKLPGVLDISSNVTLREMKYTTELPLDIL